MTEEIKNQDAPTDEAVNPSCKKEHRLAWLDELTQWSAPLLKDLPPSDKIGDLLFDKETGLPL